LTFATLASGSSGNAALVGCAGTYILLDAGISARRITTGLRALGVNPAQLSAILITHEHHDHISGLTVLTKQLRVPIFASRPTCGELYRRIPFVEDLLHSQEPGQGIELGGLWVESFSTPHDASGSVGYSIAGGGRRVVLCTDLGHITPEVQRAVAGCDLLICEANHDEDWVRSGPYPYYLKRRVLGDWGHLSNEAGAELAALGVETGAQAVVLAHLSAENNTPARAREAACRRLRAMGCDPERDIGLWVAPRGEPGPVYRLGPTGGRVLLEEREGALC
jgi:phosphoribosyl 1,2-cyclic phosphodiesterase